MSVARDYVLKSYGVIVLNKMKRQRCPKSGKADGGASVDASRQCRQSMVVANYEVR